MNLKKGPSQILILFNVQPKYCISPIFFQFLTCMHARVYKFPIPYLRDLKLRVKGVGGGKKIKKEQQKYMKPNWEEKITFWLYIY